MEYTEIIKTVEKKKQSMSYHQWQKVKELAITEVTELKYLYIYIYIYQELEFSGFLVEFEELEVI